MAGIQVTDNPEWFLEVEGSKTGPYSAEQVIGLFQDGEILPHHKVTAERLKGEWITVQELAAASKSAQKPGSFQPPPRPAELEASGAGCVFAGKKSPDPATSLFDALQAAKDRKTAAKLSPPASGDWGKPAERKHRRIPPQTWFILTVALVLGISIWGMVKLIRNGLSRHATSSPQASMQKPAAPAPGPAAGTGPPPEGTDPFRYKTFPPPNPGSVQANPWSNNTPPKYSGASPDRERLDRDRRETKDLDSDDRNSYRDRDRDDELNRREHIDRAYPTEETGRSDSRGAQTGTKPVAPNGDAAAHNPEQPPAFGSD